MAGPLTYRVKPSPTRSQPSPLQREEAVYSLVVSRKAASLGRASVLTFALAAVGYVVWRVHQWQQFLALHAAKGRSDFALYYLQAKVGRSQGWSHVYDLTAQTAVYRTISPPLKTFPIIDTPPVGWLAAPFTLLRVDTAWVVWVSIVAGCYVLAWALIASGKFEARLAVLIMSLGLFPTVFEITLGQVVPLQILGFAAAFVLMSRNHDIAAGVCLAGIALHPQGWLLIPAALLVLSRWKVLTALCGTVAILSLASVLNLGVHGTRAFIHRISYANHHPDVFEVWKTLTIPAVAHSAEWTVILDGLVIGIVVATAWRARGGDLRLPLVAALIGSLLIAPYEHINDLILLTVAAWLLCGLRPTLQGALLAVASVALLAYNIPTTGNRWGYLVILAEGVWLACLYASTTTGPLRLLAAIRTGTGGDADHLTDGVLANGPSGPYRSATDHSLEIPERPPVTAWCSSSGMKIPLPLAGRGGG